jgi:hypothetical protein
MVGRFAFQGNQSLETVDLTITGIASVEDFARVQRFMDNLRVADKLDVLSVAAGRITYRIAVQGGSERLENALGLSNLLERSGSGFAIDAKSPFGRMSPQDVAIGNRLEYRLRRPSAPQAGQAAAPGN